MTRWISSDERFEVMPDTSPESGLTPGACAICQSEPLFRSVVRSPDSDLIVNSSILSASTVNAFSFFSASPPAGFLDSTK